MVGQRNTYKERLCKECGKSYMPRRLDQVFCSKPCKTDEQNRALVRGKQAYRMLYHWRLGNGKGSAGSLLGEASRLARSWVEQDRKEGRLPPPKGVKTAADMIGDREWQARRKASEKALGEAGI